MSTAAILDSNRTVAQLSWAMRLHQATIEPLPERRGARWHNPGLLARGYQKPRLGRRKMGRHAEANTTQGDQSVGCIAHVQRCQHGSWVGGGLMLRSVKQCCGSGA